MPHNQITGWTLLAGLAAFLLLGWLAELEPHLQERRTLAASAIPHRAVNLSDDNLADAIVRLDLQERVSRVAWDHSILSVDLMLRLQPGGHSVLGDDLYRLARFSLGETTNIRHLLVRVYQDHGSREALLFYGDMSKQDWPRDRLAELRVPVSVPDGDFIRLFGLSVTPEGMRWLQNLAI
jgi:hypothetical protein